MAQQTINIGAAPNDGTGTPLRTSFDYTNQNFTELYTALGGGVGLPGATTQVIFNDGGTNLAGDAGLTYDKTTDALTVVGALSGSKLTVTGGTIPANGVYLPAANTLEFAANSLAQYRIAPLGVFSWYDGAGGTRMTLNSTGLGVGVSPSVKFEVGVARGVNVNGLIIGSSGTGVVNDQLSLLIKPVNTGAGQIFGVGIGCLLEAAASNRGSLLFYVSDTVSTAERARIDSNGNLLVGVVTVNANGGVLQLKSGITFPATQVASSDANTLDDYEEGTFTPTIIGETAAGVGVYSRQDGIYTKIGNRVFFSIFIAWSAHTGTGNMLISALPFVSNTASGNFTAVTFGWYDGLALTASYVLGGYIANGRSRIEMTQNPVGGGSAGVVAMDVSAGIMVSGSYIV